MKIYLSKLSALVVFLGVGMTTIPSKVEAVTQDLAVCWFAGSGDNGWGWQEYSDDCAEVWCPSQEPEQEPFTTISRDVVRATNGDWYVTVGCETTGGLNQNTVIMPGVMDATLLGCSTTPILDPWSIILNDGYMHCQHS